MDNDALAHAKAIQDASAKATSVSLRLDLLESLIAEIERLNVENAALRERLDGHRQLTGIVTGIGDKRS